MIIQKILQISFLTQVILRKDNNLFEIDFKKPTELMNFNSLKCLNPIKKYSEDRVY